MHAQGGKSSTIPRQAYVFVLKYLCGRQLPTNTKGAKKIGVGALVHGRVFRQPRKGHWPLLPIPGATSSWSRTLPRYPDARRPRGAAPPGLD